MFNKRMQRCDVISFNLSRIDKLNSYIKKRKDRIISLIMDQYDFTIGDIVSFVYKHTGETQYGWIKSVSFSTSAPEYVNVALGKVTQVDDVFVPNKKAKYNFKLGIIHLNLIQKADK